jgi:hypothetical protein
VGQYVGERANLILNLEGLAKNLKRLGDGKVWIVGTAQQTLTEDDPRAALNSPELYKLKDRFPIQIDLESSDIKEICYRRLLGKSAEGEQALGELFEPTARRCATTPSCRTPSTTTPTSTSQTFTNLYPFLPAHFDILLHLLGALAKSTGGIGLRSAIKVIQDILIEGAGGPSRRWPISRGLAGHHRHPLRRWRRTSAAPSPRSTAVGKVLRFASPIRRFTRRSPRPSPCCRSSATCR